MRSSSPIPAEYGAGGVPPEVSLQAKIQRDRRKSEDQRNGNRDAIEVLLNHRRSLRRRTHGTTEHVGQSATFTAVEQDEKDQPKGSEHLNDDVDSSHSEFPSFLALQG